MGQKTHHRIVKIMLAALMLMMGLMLCMSAAVYADGEHTHDGITFTAWTDELAAQQFADPTKNASNCLPFQPGNYYLTKDVTLHETWHPLNSKTTRLCLNGRKVMIKDEALTAISLEHDSTLYVFDCRYNHDSPAYSGSISTIGDAAYGNAGRGVEVGPGSHFIMYGGMIRSLLTGVKVKDQGTFTLKDGWIWCNNTGVKILTGGTVNMEGGKVVGNGLGQKKDGGGVDTDEGGTFQMTRGEIWHNNNYGARINGNFRIADNPVIHGNIVLGGNSDCDVLLKNKCLITVFDTFNPNASVGVTMDNPGIVTDGYWREANKLIINSNDSRYEAVIDGGEVYLKLRSKITEDMINALSEPTEDQSAVDAAVSEYLSLDDSQKALVSDDALQKLVRLADENTLQKLVGDENYMIQGITENAKARSTKITGAKNKKGKRILVKWKKTSDITGYRILYGTDRTFKKVKEKTVTAKATSTTLSKLKTGKTYYIQVRPCTKVTNRVTGESKIILGKALNTKKVIIKK